MPIVAAIDIGTNSTRLLVAETAGGRVSVLKSGLITTRLGEGISDGLLTAGAMERTVGAIGYFAETARLTGAGRVVAAATSAVRDASNREEFIALAGERAGLKVRVLSGVEEASLSYRGVLSGLDVNPGDTAVVDVGGGSTELVWPAPGGLICRSANAGAVRMSVSNAGEAEIAEAIELILSGARRDGVRNLIGVGGTITTCAAIDLGLVHYSPAKTHGYVLTAGIIKKILSKLKGLETEARKKVPGLQPERADIIVAGVTIVKLVLKGLGLDRLRVSESDILQGLVLEEVEKLSGINYQK